MKPKHPQTPKCMWCEAEKKLITGLCPKCHRFNSPNYDRYLLSLSQDCSQVLHETQDTKI